jgi:hypothetical protein
MKIGLPGKKRQIHIQKIQAAVPPKYWYLFTKLLNIISQKTTIFINTFKCHLKKQFFLMRALCIYGGAERRMLT